MSRYYGGGGESWGSRFAENLTRGVQVGYDIGERRQERKRTEAIRTGQKEAFDAGGQFATKADFDAFTQKLTETYAANGDLEGLQKAQDAAAKMLSGKITEGLKSVQMQAMSGDMQGAAATLPQVFSYLPTGSTVQTGVDDQGKVYIRPIDEATGQPKGEGYALDQNGLAEMAGMYAADPDKWADYLLRKMQATSESEYRKGSLGVQQGQLALAGDELKLKGALGWAGIGADYARIDSQERMNAADNQTRRDITGAEIGSAERRQAIDVRSRADIAAADRKQSDLNSRRNFSVDTMRSRLEEARLGQTARLGEMQVGVDVARLNAEQPGREASALLDSANADKIRNEQLLGKGLQQWNTDDLRAAEGSVSQMIGNMVNQDVGSGNIDIPRLQGRAMQIIRSNLPGSVSAADAVALTMDLATRTGDFTFRKAPNGQIWATDDKSGRGFYIEPSAYAELQNAHQGTTP